MRSSDAGMRAGALVDFAVRLRAVDEAAEELASRGVVAWFSPLRPREGLIAALAFSLRDGDWVFPPAQGPDGAGIDWATHRGARWVAGSSPNAARLGHATGAAWGLKLRGERGAAITWFGPASIDSAEFHTALNFAAVYGAPAVFVCASPEPISVEQARHWGEAFGLHAEITDGDDAVAAQAAVESALRRAREGRGPTLLFATVGLRDAVEVAATRAKSAGTALDLEALHERARGDAQMEARRALAPAASDSFYLQAFAAQPPPNLD